MNVKELIQCLKQFPMDSEVVLMEERKLKHQERLSCYIAPLNKTEIIYGCTPASLKPCVQINYTDYSKL